MGGLGCWKCETEGQWRNGNALRTNNPMHLSICLGNIGGKVKVQVNPDAAALLPAPVATVHDLRALSVWPKELAVTIHSWEPPEVTIRRV
jgi:hypothetical protein